MDLRSVLCASVFSSFFSSFALAAADLVILLLLSAGLLTEDDDDEEEDLLPDGVFWSTSMSPWRLRCLVDDGGVMRLTEARVFLAVGGATV